MGDPRGVLRRVLQRSRDMGFDAFNIGPELEFFLFETDDQGHATTLTRDEAATSIWAPWTTVRAPAGRSA